ncbi:hypothetical protein [Gloeobacter kilaueensis]|uniref:Uncharacterized protein n=1 Tax=Gloeobacter kilaueensis (strain ATCC BAA-2537 / CCAP 1431/1 / ULC 316 / JS1) TaxID=1183438 RepID=U5QCT9_GLOK1|nr:hypothetical protein [Gloeobacter kilaueensis]AGY56696.1 hypothetical protein GKIL_0450 [Gloeobacter kilaueensis JS1]
MPGKRSHYKRRFAPQCPDCELQVYRLNSTRHSIYIEGAEAIARALSIPYKRALLIASQGPIVDRNQWLEEFYCPMHGRVWLQVVRERSSGQIRAQLPDAALWKRSIGTLDPNHPNPSVSEFTLSNSRSPQPNLLH